MISGISLQVTKLEHSRKKLHKASKLETFIEICFSMLKKLRGTGTRPSCCIPSKEKEKEQN